MSETEGFRMAMKLSKQEAGIHDDSDEEKDTPVQDKKEDMEALMSDTAGFQKILEMSKREEEERIKK